MSSKQILIRLDEGLLEKLRRLHRKEGPMNARTKKRRPFNVFIRNILHDYVYDRLSGRDKVDDPKGWTDADLS